MYAVDPQLVPFRAHLDYRWSQYQEMKNNLEKAGGLEDFALGHKYFGFTVGPTSTVYREWAPAAKAVALIGDFNEWQPWWMEKDEWGVWSINIPHVNGQPAIAHGSRVKVRLQSYEGWTVDRIPAYIQRSVIPPGIMGAKYDGVFWNPDKGEQYSWKHPRPSPPRSLRIYEAHVGMSSEDPKVSTYAEFRDDVLPRIAKLGYTAVQLMAIQEHAYYASFGYHVTNPFAVSSRCGTPEDLKSLVDEAHRLGLLVFLDVVHSHISSNADDGLAGFDLGQSEDMNYFCGGDRGYHRLWDSRCLNYRNWEVLKYLLSNLRYWLEEFKFDGFRFDGVTSMLYHDHGIHRAFSGAYHEYLGENVNVDAVVYLMLANELVHKVLPQAITIAEDVSGMPALCRPVSEGGVGFDYRLNMAVPDHWIKLLKHQRDEQWSMSDLITALCNRRYTEKTIGYAESHDQALVGDKTIAMWLMDAEMYSGMSALQTPSPVIERGIALHKIIRGITFTLGGEGWLNFMGNEFGHPEWLDFPREGNDWSHWYCRRQWSLPDTDHLRYKFLLAWDRALMKLDEEYDMLSSPHQWVTHIENDDQVIVAERGPLVWVFNLSPFNTYEGYKVAVPEGGKYRAVLSSDAEVFGGSSRVGEDTDHFSTPEETPFHERGQSIMVLAPSRTAVAYARVREE